MTNLKLHGVRMWVTEGCNASCHFCMNKDERSNSMMEIDKYIELCYYFKENGFDKISIMGGEPTIHPDFLKIMQIAQDNFQYVYLFTNAIKSNELELYTPRQTDIIVYNSHFIKRLTNDKLLSNKLGKRVIDVVVNEFLNVQLITNQIFDLAKINSTFAIQLVLDSKCNIFAVKEKIIANVNKLYQNLSSLASSHEIIFSCNAPICFTHGTNLPYFTPNTICSPRAVLIDSLYNVRFCNIYPTKLINMYENNRLISIEKLEQSILEVYNRLRNKCLEKICNDCILNDKFCNGKCHIALNNITREDIVKNTNLQWLQ